MHGEAHLTLVLGNKDKAEARFLLAASLAELASSGAVKALVSEVRLHRNGRPVLSAAGLHRCID